MAPRPKKRGIDYSKFNIEDIKKINKVRPAQGTKFKSLPVKNNKGYDNVRAFSQRKYAGKSAEFATKAISLRISRYQAEKLNKMNKQQAYTYLNQLVNKESFGGTDLDRVIRNQNIQQYGSDTINQLADRDEALAIAEFKSGNRNGQDFLKRGNLKAI